MAVQYECDHNREQCDGPEDCSQCIFEKVTLWHRVETDASGAPLRDVIGYWEGGCRGDDYTDRYAVDECVVWTAGYGPRPEVTIDATPDVLSLSRQWAVQRGVKWIVEDSVRDAVIPALDSWCRVTRDTDLFKAGEEVIVAECYGPRGRGTCYVRKVEQVTHRYYTVYPIATTDLEVINPEQYIIAHADAYRQAAQLYSDARHVFNIDKLIGSRVAEAVYDDCPKSVLDTPSCAAWEAAV